ncbi:MAG: Trk system potassium transporter TrkA [Gammaproteobacteria bacterium]|nr:Trk system potassium transporter TrkA [Gammaproteobacteria bacterium]MDH5660006.1 Trk system potassium transporter TrkA [Gammaproteobacteria bacterium]
MKIIILGAGQVGSSLAENLTSEANDITIIDKDEKTLLALQDRLDLRTITGHASHPDILRAAGADDADMLIAVTDSDETNMVACQVAYTVFHTPTKIARVRALGYLSHPQLFQQEALPVDVLISPEQLITEYIQSLITHPGSLQVLDFADKKVQLVGVRAYYGGPLVGHELSTIKKHMPTVEIRVAAIYRRDRAIIPQGNTVIEADDEVFFVATPKCIRSMISELRRLDKPYKRIMIVGGGNIGKRLAEALEDDYQVKIIDHNTARAHNLAKELKNTIVLNGDASDGNLLTEENIDNTDIFCSVTNDEEANILSAMLAKRLGARKVMALINRAAYVDLIQGGDIDIAISPQQSTISSLLAHVRRGDVVKVHSLRRGAAEAIEAIAHGDKTTSKVVGREVGTLKLPYGTTIGAVVRGNDVIIAHHDTVIESEDHVILFLIDKKYISDVEKLFQVGITFI